MKIILPFPFIIIIVWLTSCTKKMDVVHDIHDTVYLTQIKVDTFHSIVIRIDTVIKQDNHTDTVIQKVLDTVFIKTTKTDTLYQYYYDTAYLAKVSHDSITKTIYLHDTINNYVNVIKHDTVIQVNTITVTDTLFRYNGTITNPYIPGDSSVYLVSVLAYHPTSYFSQVIINDLTTYDSNTGLYGRSFTINLDTANQHVGDGIEIKYPSFPIYSLTVNLVDSVSGVAGAVYLHSIEDDETRSKRIRYEGYYPLGTLGFSPIYPGEFLKIVFQ